MTLPAQGVSAADAEASQETIDNGTKNADHPVKERSHPLSQRESVYDRYKQHRATETPDGNTAASGLGVAELEEEETDEEVAEPPAQEAAKAAVVPDEEKVEDFIVKDQAGKAMFKTVVDGKEVLVPLSRARAQLQKHEAADVRLQTASERLREADRLKAAAEQSAPRSPSATDVSAEVDEASLKEANELVTALIEEEPEAAAKKLATVLVKGRAQKVDPKTVAAEVAAINRQQETDAALIEGFTAYLAEYGNTVDADPALKAWHAAKVDALISEHPEWSPKQAMLEAGQQACKFAGIERESQASEAATGTKPAAEQPLSRQQRKQELQPVPQNRSAVRGTGGQEKPQAQSPSDVISEMRKARGQPTGVSR